MVRLLGQPDEARRLDTVALNGLERALSPVHPHFLAAQLNLGGDLAATGRLDQARGLDEKTLALSRRVHGESHPFTLASTADLAVDHMALGERQAAATLHEKALAGYRACLSWDRHHPIITAVSAGTE